MEWDSYTCPFTVTGVFHQDIAHVLELDVTWHGEHGRRQVAFKRAEEERSELQLMKVIVAIWLVLGARVQSQTVRRRRQNDGPVCRCGLCVISLVYGSFESHRDNVNGGSYIEISTCVVLRWVKKMDNSEQLLRVGRGPVGDVDKWVKEKFV